MTTYPITLSLELSHRTGSIAMMNDNGDVECRNVDIGKREKDDIFPSMEKLSRALSITPRHMELVVVSSGPGGFTGLRTSTSIAKMIALASGAKLVSVESAIVIASQAALGDGPFLVISSVKRDHFWLSTVQNKDGGWMCESNNASVDTLKSSVDGILAVFADEFIPDNAKSILSHCHIPLHQSNPNAETLLKIGLNLYTKGTCIEPEQLSPIYSREPEAVRMWQERHSPPT